MVSFTITTLALAALASIASASPTARLAQRDAAAPIEVTFIGAAGAQFTQSIPFNSQFTPTSNVLSVSHITTSGGPCVFFGIDDAVLFTFDAAVSQDFGPPQTVAGAICGPPPTGW